MKLYEINEAYQDLLNLDLEQEDFQLVLESIKTELNDKAENIGYILLNIDSDVIALDNEIKRLQAKKQALSDRFNNLKDYLAYSMQSMEVSKIETPVVNFSFRKSESLIVDNQDVIPKEYLKEKVSVSVDKTSLKKAIKNGTEIEGCHIEVKQNLQVK